MFIIHLALGGCLTAPPVRFGITADTGGHIAYVLDAAIAQASLAMVDKVSIVTRQFVDDRLGTDHALGRQRLGDRLTIDRIATGNPAYLEKEALAAELPAFVEAFDAHLGRLDRLPDVIHAHFADAAAVALAIRARRGIAVVYTPHALGIDKLAQQDGRTSADADPALGGRIAAERRAIAEADAIVVSTHDEADRQISAYRIAGAAVRIRRISPGVPSCDGGDGPGHAPIALDQWLADPAKPIVLAIARPVRKKNLAALVRAFVATPALADRANLVILAGQHDGRSSDEERAVVAELRRLCADPRLAGRVALPPAHDRSDVEALYRLAAHGGVFVNPAFHEPFGLTLIEAAANRVPVVATANGGPCEIVAAIGHGLLVDPRDEAAIGDACLTIVGDPALHARMAQAAHRNVHRYSWASYAAESVALYGDVATPVRRLTPRTILTIRGDGAVPRLLASDIDNTLTGCAIGARRFAEWCADRPIPFVVATGRSFAAARAVLAQWRLPMPDAFIVDVGTRIVEQGADGGWRECPDYAAALDLDWDRAGVVAALAPLPLTPQPAETAGPHKLSFFGSAGDAAAIRATLAAQRLAARVVFSHGHLIDVLAPHAGKAAAIAAWAARHGLTLADCVAAGDSGNDLDMLDACGHAIVVANAGDELDGLVPRPGLRRAGGRHAAGVMEGLAALGLVDAGAGRDRQAAA